MVIQESFLDVDLFFRDFISKVTYFEMNMDGGGGGKCWMSVDDV